MATGHDFQLDKLHSLLFARFFHAFTECNDEVQAAIREMIAIAVDVDADDDEREMALAWLPQRWVTECRSIIKTGRQSGLWRA